MTPDQREYFDKMEQLFATDGWKVYISDIEGNLEALKDSALSLSSIEDFYIAKGRMLGLNQTLGFEDLIDNLRKDLEDSE